MPTEARDDIKRKILDGRLENVRAEAYLATINAQASRHSAQAMERAGLKAEAKSLIDSAYESEKKARAFGAAAEKYAELLAALPPEPEAPTEGTE